MKLFKKALAAVLAGVMALSMVACAPATTETETEIKVDPTSSVTDQLLEYMNKYSAAKVTDGTYKNAVEFKNELASEAQAVLDALTAGELDQYGNSIKLTADQKTAVVNAQKGGYTYWLSLNEGDGWQQVTTPADSYRLATYEYKKSTAEKWVRTVYVTGESGLVTVDAASNKVAATYQIGLASKVVNGKTLVVLALKAI